MQLGNYQLVAEIARGGMGIVYLAARSGPARFNKLVVIKELKPELVDDPGFLEMFLEEARLAARLSHPNIVQTHEVGNDDNRHYIVMDYLEGTTLARIIRRKIPGFTQAMHLRILCEVLRGLHYAHTLTDFDGTPLGIVHRDATPHNVFVTYDGQVKLVDFGIAKATDSTIETNTGVFKGKPSYTAPEQIRGEADARADVYTAGVMLWEALAGRRMWHKHTDVEVLTRILEGKVPSLREEAPDAPEDLVALAEHALAPDYRARLESALDLATAIERHLVEHHGDLSLREIAKVLVTEYASERAGVRAIIDTHLMGIELGTARQKLPTLRAVGPLSESSTEAATPTHDTSGNSSFPSAVATNVPPVQDRTEVMPFAPAKLPVIVPPAGLEGSGESPNRGASRAKLASVIAGASLVAVFGLVVILLRARGPETPSSVPPAISAASSDPAMTPSPSARVPETVPPPPPSPPPVASHALAVRVFPLQATITIDGTEVKNPVSQSCTHAKPLAVHASMAGHLSADRALACEQDESIEIALAANAPPPRFPGPPPRAAPAPTPPPKPVSAAHPRPTPTPATTPPRKPSAAPEVNPAGGSKPLRPIETASPYGK